MYSSQVSQTVDSETCRFPCNAFVVGISISACGKSYLGFRICPFKVVRKMISVAYVSAMQHYFVKIVYIACIYIYIHNISTSMYHICFNMLKYIQRPTKTVSEHQALRLVCSSQDLMGIEQFCIDHPTGWYRIHEIWCKVDTFCETNVTYRNMGYRFFCWRNVFTPSSLDLGPVPTVVFVPAYQLFNWDLNGVCGWG